MQRSTPENRPRIVLRSLILLTVGWLSTLGLPVQADTWKYSLDDAFQKRTDQTGRERHSIDSEIIDYYLNRIASHARSYPPSFESAAQRREVGLKLRLLIDVLGIVADDDSELMLRYAFAQSMGHNLDFEGSAAEAVGAFEKFLQAQPDDRRGNYRYGMFLASTKHGQRACPYLEQALAAGEEAARYTLGLLELQFGDREKGLRLLEQYTQNAPENIHARRMLTAAREGKLSFQKSQEPSTTDHPAKGASE